MKHTPIEIKESLETWQGGKSTGYFDPFTNEIHYLKGADLEFRALFHERIHASRQEKLTFKFASLLAIPIIKNLLFGVALVLAVYALIAGPSILSAVPFLFVASLFGFLAFCHDYEENIADKLTIKSCQEIKHNNGGENSR